MARRRTRPLSAGAGSADSDVMPRVVLLSEDREVQRTWCEDRGLFTFREQWDARTAAMRAHGLRRPTSAEVHAVYEWTPAMGPMRPLPRYLPANEGNE